MAVTIAEVLERLGARAPWSRAAGWDPVGLQLGDPQAPVRRMGLCHEVTRACVEALEREPVDLLISYHPLLFRPGRSLLAGPTPEGRALRLLRAGVALGVVHTNFDVAPGGTADALADALGILEARGFGPLHGPETRKLVTFLPGEAADRVLEAVVRAGAGRIGSYSHCSYRGEGIGTFFAGPGTRPVMGVEGALNREPEVRLECVVPRSREDAVIAALVGAHPYEEPAFDLYDRRGDAGLVGRIGSIEPMTLADLVGRVREALGEAALRVAGDPGRTLVRVAVVPGSGGDFLSQAADAGADAVVTGDLTHHRAREALDRGLCLLDPGHVPTERPGLARLLAALAALGVECRSLLAVDPDPWRPAVRPGSGDAAG